MSKPNKIADYLKTVCDQIRWKKAHATVSRELEDHIIDQKNAYQNNGIDEEKATDEAIRQMGDPIMVGTQLDGTYRPKPDWAIVIFTITTLFLGVALRVYVNYIELGGTYYQPYPGYFSSIIIPVIIGLAIFAAAYLIDFTIFGKYARFTYIIFLIIAYALKILLGPQVPMNFIMLMFPVIYVGIVYRQRNKGFLGLLMCGLYLILPAYICWVSLSTFAMLMVMCLLILTFAVYKNWFKIKKLYGFLFIYVIPLALIIFVLYRNYSYFIWEITDNPLLYNVKTLLNTSKFIGSGAYASTLPSDFYLQTNFGLAYLIHKFGWISFIGIMSILSALITKGFMQCKKQSSMLGKFVSYSVLVTIATQVVFTVIANFGILPTLASTMPLISHHSYGIIINMLLIGIMLSVFKTGGLVTDMHIQNQPLQKGVELLKGKLVINIRR